jgi:hypothetical protein
MHPNHGTKLISHIGNPTKAGEILDGDINIIPY